MKQDAATSAFALAPVSQTASPATRFATGEDGGITIYGLFLFLSMIAVSAAALDVSRLLSVRSQLQLTADTAAHAALYMREYETSDNAKLAALDLVEAEMPYAKYGTVVDGADIVFGSWDAEAQAFSPDASSRDAVLVSATMSEARTNAVESFLFRILGYDTFNVKADSVFETYRPTCLREGFVADGVVDVQSNNLYGGGFCVHSNTYVSLNSNSTFEPGSIISMPDTNLLDAPTSATATNDGLSEALRSGSYRLRILNKMDDIMAGLTEGDWSVLPDYVSGTAPITLWDHDGHVNADDFTPGRVHMYNCQHNNGRIIFDPDTMLRDVVLVTNDCRVTFSQGVVLEDVLIATTSTSDRSITAPSGLQLGRDDDCADGGGVQLLTKGGMEFASDLSLYGAQLMAEGDITFSANAEGIQGASIISGGVISGTSNMAMGYCGGGMDNAYAADYFRMRH